MRDSFKEWVEIWHETGIWRKCSFEDFIKGIVQIMKQNETGTSNRD